MCLAVCCNRKERALYCSAVKRYLYAVLCTDKALRLCDMDVISCSADGDLNIKLSVSLSQDRFNSQAFACELNTEALEER